MNAEKESFHIVGIGASAGGLEALESFFTHMPATDNLAFVVVQHLSPDYKSLMAELLAKHTTMPIMQGEDGVEVVPGRIYLIPRKKNMTIYKRKLFLTEQEHGLNLPIDIFLRSLAEDAGEKAVGVILSGTGSDGTRGIRAIKEAGGLVIVQDGDDAKFDGMPRSAVSTGIVDFILPAAKIPEELGNFVSGNVRITTDPSGARLGGPNSIAKVFMLIKRKTGVDLSFYKESTIYRRIERRMGINQIMEVPQYIELLETSPGEITTLYKEILIGVTKFFRDYEAFDVLSREVIPQIFNHKESGEPIRIWVAGCSTGEEAYSIAIQFAEYAEEHHLRHDIKIFATDIDKDALEHASYGLYPESIAADASSERLARFFIRKGENYQIIPAIREMVVFAYHNIFKDPPFRNIDLVSCRNLLIYLQPVLQKKVLSNFHFSLNSNGYLFLGSSETVGELSKYFRTIDTRWKVFSFSGEYKPRELNLTPPEGGWRDRFEVPEQRFESIPRATRIAEPVYESLIEDFLPPGAIINDERQIVHNFGDTDPFLRLPPGRMDLDILKMARSDIAIPLGTAIQTAISEDRESGYSDLVVVHDDGTASTIRLTVRPLHAGRNTRYYAVLFEPGEKADGDERPVASFDLDESVRKRIADLEGELKYTKENLQATIEELETSNEELQATNEELLSSNEELQSTNEELQSVNEELITVNSEYQKKIEELSELNDDMDNLLSGTAYGTVFLDQDLTIRKYTAPAADQINIIKTDVGRPFSDLSHNLIYDNLLEDITTVGSADQPMELEVQNKSGHWFLVKIQPYRTEHENSRGIVLSLIDITERKSAELALLRQHELLMRVLDTNPTAIVMLDHRGRIIYANRHGERVLGYTRQELGSMRLEDQAFAADFVDENGPLDRIRRDKKPIDDTTISLTPGGDGSESVEVVVNGNPIFDENGEVEGAVLNLRRANEDE